MSRPTAARIAKRKRQAEERRERRRKRLVTTGWPVDAPPLLPAAIPPQLMDPTLFTGSRGWIPAGAEIPVRIQATFSDPPRIYHPQTNPTTAGP